MTIADRLVGHTSLGVQRRAAFAAALAHQPEFLVLDEPTSGVDALARAELWDTVHRSAEGGTAVLVTTHHMDEAEQCDRLVMIVAGQILADGPVDAIVADGRSIAVRTERWDETFSALDADGLNPVLHGTTVRLRPGDQERARRLLAARRIHAELTVVPATLEETFVRLASQTPGQPRR